MGRKGGDWVEHINRLIRDPVTGHLGDFVIAMRDVTERRNLEDRLLLMASTDGLTGLANRREFDRRLAEEWGDAVRERRPLSLLLIDLDHFKGFNDEYRHLIGDDCLRAVAKTVASAMDIVGAVAARYGGEEFAALLPRTDARRALRQASLARGAVEALGISHASNPEGRSRVTISLGAATVLCRKGVTAGTPSVLIAAADTALYKAKRNGRNRIETAFLSAPSAARSPVLGAPIHSQAKMFAGP